MTREDREDAIDIIQSILDKYEEDECLVTEITIGDEDIKAFKMAIKAIEQEPVLDEVRAEIREWYWQADKQELAKDPCVVDAMIDLFIRTIAKYQAEVEPQESEE